MRTLHVSLLLLGLALPGRLASAQDLKKAADAASYATWGTALTLDLKDSWQSEDRGHALQLFGARIFTTWVGATALKEITHAPRPCAATHECGIDREDTDFPSLHTAFTFSTVGGKHWKRQLLLAAATGVLRRAANKHDWLGVGGGIALGAITGSIR